MCSTTRATPWGPARPKQRSGPTGQRIPFEEVGPFPQGVAAGWENRPPSRLNRLRRRGTIRRRQSLPWPRRNGSTVTLRRPFLRDREMKPSRVLWVTLVAAALLCIAHSSAFARWEGNVPGGPEGWKVDAPREEIRPQFAFDAKGGPDGQAPWSSVRTGAKGSMGAGSRRSRSSVDGSTTSKSSEGWRMSRWHAAVRLSKSPGWTRRGNG